MYDGQESEFMADDHDDSKALPGEASEALENVHDLVVTAAQDIGSFIRAQREAAHVSLRQLARMAGVSNPYLSQVERGLRNPSGEVLTQIAKGLRVSSEALYVRAGLLEQRPHGPIRDAVLADTFLTERQKQVLLDIYESFRRENDQAAAVQPPTSNPTAVSDAVVAVATDSKPRDKENEQ